MSRTDPGAPGPLSPAEASDLGHLLRQVLGTTAVATQIWVARRHDDYAVLLVRLAGSSARLVVKLAGPRAPIAALFDRTAAILRSVRDRTTVPTVDVLAADVSYCHGPWRYLITTYAPGSPWSTTLPRLTTEEARSVHRELGEAVAEIHLLDFPAFGEISVDGTIQPGASYLPALVARSTHRIANPHHVERFVALLDERAADFGDVRQATLCHEDLHPGNILLRRTHGRWGLSAIIDFDSAWAGNPESDLARLELWRGMAGEGFWDGYGSHGRVTTTYADRRLLLQLLWCLEYASPTPQHVDDTDRICAGLGIRPFHFP